MNATDTRRPMAPELRAEVLHSAARLPADPLGDEIAVLIVAALAPGRAAARRADRQDAAIMGALTYQRDSGTIV